MNDENKQYLNNLIKTAKEKVKEKYGVEIKSKIAIDENKTLEENKLLILTKIKQERDVKKEVVKKTPNRKQVSEEEKKVLLKKLKEEKERMDKVMEKINSNIKCDNVDITKHYERLRKSVELVGKGYLNCCFLHSSAGLGKSYQTTATLNDLGLKYDKDYIEFSGDISLAYLYRFIYENNGKIIIFRDLFRLLNELKGIDMFKGMTETHSNRVISKANYSKNQKDLPPSFECKSRFIFEFNSLKFNGLKEDIQALFSRGDYLTLTFSLEQIKDIMLQICKNEDEKAVTEFLIDNYKFYGLNNLNLRTQHKAFKIYQYAKENSKNWEEELLIFLKGDMSSIRRQLYTYMGEKVFKTIELKKILIRAGIDNCYHLRTADRRIREWVILGELFVVGFISKDEEELEDYLNSRRNFLVSLNPIEKITLSDTNDKISSEVKVVATT